MLEVLSGGSADIASGVSGSLAVISAGTVVVDSGGNVASDFQFAGSGGTLSLNGQIVSGSATSGFVAVGTISGFAPGDTIDLAPIAYVNGATATLDTTSGNTLDLVEGGKTYQLNLQANQLFLGESFVATSAGSGTDITLVATPISGAASVPTGKAAYGVQVASGGTVDVQSGGTLSGGTISSGGSLTISSGGTAEGATVSDGGHQIVASGGIASNTILTDPGSGTVASGGTAVNYTVSGGFFDVFGTATGTVVESGSDNTSGLLIVENGGAAISTIVSAGGVENVFGSDRGGTIYSGGVENDYGSVSDATVAGSLTVLSGGRVDPTTI
jgi:autotransporter passenger strand-loop-strand repeat protein